MRGRCGRAAPLPWPALALALPLLGGCGGSGDLGEATGESRQEILGGAVVDAPDSPVVYLNGPEGACSGVLVAPNLAITARHCVAKNTPGKFACTASGDLVPGSGTAGQLGVDDPASSLHFYTESRVASGTSASGTPDAVGTLLVDTQSTTACRDDLAFVVLDRALAGLSVAPIRLNLTTVPGESVSVLGYGLTDAIEPTLLRERSDATITGVGPDMPSTLTQPAPVRAVRTSPVTCQGDSGGPILSNVTGGVIAVVSLGSQAGATGPFCSSSDLVDTLGPRLGAYRALALQAFQAAGATPVTDDPGDASAPDATTAPDGPASDDGGPAPETSDDDAAASDATGGSPDASASEPDGAPLDAASEHLHALADPLAYRATGGCATAPSGGGEGSRGLFSLMLALTAVAVGRRRR